MQRELLMISALGAPIIGSGASRFECYWMLVHRECCELNVG